MRRTQIAYLASIVAGLVTLSGTASPASESLSFVEYQGQRVEVARTYRDFDEYKEDPRNLTAAQAQRIEALVRKADFGPAFKDAAELDRTLAKLQFPGYGLFYANQLGARIDPTLELVYVEVPARSMNRYIVLEREPRGSLLVVEDFLLRVPVLLDPGRVDAHVCPVRHNV